jgi:signal transduction histidine kinase
MASISRGWARIRSAEAARALAQFAAGGLVATVVLRRIERDRRDRQRLLEGAVEVSRRERRRIAADLHDGVVQSLAGASFALAAAADRAEHDGAAEYADVLRDGAAATRGGLAELRTLLVKIHPPSLREAGLALALDDLVAPLRRRGVDVALTVCPKADLPPGVEALFFRVAQEAVRGVLARTGSHSVEIAVGRERRRARLEVVDVGCGFDVGSLGGLADVARDAGGALTVGAHPAGGVRAAVQVNVA